MFYNKKKYKSDAELTYNDLMKLKECLQKYYDEKVELEEKPSSQVNEKLENELIKLSSEQWKKYYSIK
jgi:hypothetical protein